MKLASYCVTALLLSTIFISKGAEAQNATEASGSYCESYETIYVRGSGQQIDAEWDEEGYEQERDALKRILTGHVNKQATHEFKELGGQHTQGFGAYPAVSVVGENWRTGLAAVLTNGNIGKYAASVSEGASYLNNYIESVSSIENQKCFILVGYSQGAHVVGDMIAYNSGNPGLLSKIKYIGLLGDPKLDLYGLGLIPGDNVPWRRGNAVPFWDSGSLGGRRPYVPNESGKLTIPTGSWCYNDDPVCSSNFTNDASAHTSYIDRGSVSHMALEIANIINNPHGVTKDTYPKQVCGAPERDVVVLLDTSPLMRQDASLFSKAPMYYGADKGKPLPTAGEMILRSGCGDTRVAVVGYGREQDGEPRMLLDFTKNATEYDNLLASLYEPVSGGVYERTQFREGAIKATEMKWRPGAEKAILAISNMPGSGDAVGATPSRGWSDWTVTEPYLADSLTQKLISSTRDKEIALLGLPMNVSHGVNGFVHASDDTTSKDFNAYLRMITRAVGTYNWPMTVPNYHAYDFKYSLLDTTLDTSLQLRSKLSGTVSSVRAKVGEQVNLSFTDTLGLLKAGQLRGETPSYSWYIDCAQKEKRVYDISPAISFTPTQAGSCMGAVTVSVGYVRSGGCYSGCPDPFPPYMHRTFPFTIDIKPADYVAKVPEAVKNLRGVMHADKVTYTWDEPESNGSEKIVYLVRDTDGAVLAATTARELTITDTDGTVPEVTVTANGEDGSSEPTSTTTATVVDARPPQIEPGAIGASPINQPDLTDQNDLPEIPLMVGSQNVTVASAFTNVAPQFVTSNVQGSSTEIASAALSSGEVLALQTTGQAQPSGDQSLLLSEPRTADRPAAGSGNIWTLATIGGLIVALVVIVSLAVVRRLLS